MTVTILTYKPTEAELSAIRKGEAAIARRQNVSLTEFLSLTKFPEDLRRLDRKARAKVVREGSR